MTHTNCILLPERFDYSFFQNFEKQLQALLATPSLPEQEILLDFAEVSYLDSAALGMMVMSNKQAEEKGVRMVLTNVHGLAAEIVSIAKLDQLFIIR